MLATVLRPASDSSNDGPSGRHDYVDLRIAPEPNDAFSDLPVFWLAKFCGRLIALPGIPPGGLRTPRGEQHPEIEHAMGWQASGNFLWSSDSRFRSLSQHPVPVFDRREDDRQFLAVDRSPIVPRHDLELYRQAVSLLLRATDLLARCASSEAAELLTQTPDVLENLGYSPSQTVHSPAPETISAEEAGHTVITFTSRQRAGRECPVIRFNGTK